ncbi:peptidoglycan-associated lipoprotein Pal [Parasulfitobacter algicola]|uniref:Peptidoglycan-associated lipoprotein n=1 Tax=Parasulfitobacter algicola TaxID=2614809 RepID=A0ABX2IPD0_9RHOB|nr:peptidoglycan-associated lipoprotein Pal [Sulfitobacter algicola]NSX54215.1 peptidoglycan-associated lipoprotein Pal [Sulfitobacter algicola]
MTYLKKAALMLALLGAAACTNGDRFGNNGEGGAGGPGGANGGIESGTLDPATPQYFNQTVGNTINFAVDQSTLSPSAQSVLDGQAAWLMANTTYIAVIEGHADEQGTREYNLALGARRAAAVRDYLVSKGVAGSRMRTLTYGKERPLASCSTEECYAQNRRSVTIISAAGVS